MRAEKLNSFTHLAGTLLALVGVGVLSAMAILKNDIWKMVAFGVYGATLVLLYAASTLYHSATEPAWKRALQKLDHTAIYLLIAGSYTPISLVTLRGPWGWALLAIVWSLALFGIIQELTLGKKERRHGLSMGLYIAMGCLAFIALKPLFAALPWGGLAWLFAAGTAYLSGIYFYLNDHRKHYHGIWHMFVMAGSFSHYMCLFMYVA